MKAGPVFVGGAERSGTSLIFALLASHPEIAMTRRTNLWRYFYGQYGDLSDDANLDRCLDAMGRYKRLAKLSLDQDELRSELVRGERSYPRLFQLIGEHHARSLGKPRWGDKSLHTERFADRIFQAYEGARIIHMVRDPRDRYASVETRWGFRRGGVGAGTAEWMESVALGQGNRSRHPDQYLMLSYEALVTEPERMLGEVCAFIGAEYAPEMLSMEGASGFRQQGSNSSYGRRDVGVISSDSVGRFREVLSASQMTFIQRAARRPMLQLGYDVHPVDIGPVDAVVSALITHPFEWLRFCAWRTRQRWIERRGSGGLPAYRLVRPEHSQ